MSSLRRLTLTTLLEAALPAAAAKSLGMPHAYSVTSRPERTGAGGPRTGGALLGSRPAGAHEHTPACG
jgi:hypothetical protein